jgi:hypothetical protein
VNFSIKAIADGGSELISAVQVVTMWKFIAEYPVFTDPLEPWNIVISSNKSENIGMIEYKSFAAKDY